MKISLIGCGWYGMELARHLAPHQLLGTTTTPSKLELLKALKVKPFLFKDTAPDPELLNSDVIILNIPPKPNQLDHFKSWNWQKKTWIIFISSTSVYGSMENGRILLTEEAWIQNTFPHWTILRFAGLLGQERHPGKSLSGKQNIKGKKWPVNLLHLDDAVGVTTTIIEKNIQHKILNVVSDEHRIKKDFYTEYARQHNLPLPGFDETDESTGKIIDNDELKKFYVFKHPRMTETNS